MKRFNIVFIVCFVGFVCSNTYALTLTKPVEQKITNDSVLKETGRMRSTLSENIINTSTQVDSVDTEGCSKWDSLQGWYVDKVIPSRTSVDYAQIITVDTEVLMFGEKHTVAQVKTELAQNMAMFKELGFTHLGIEMFNSDIQEILDEYYETGANRDEVLQHLNNFWGWTTNMPEEYLKVIDAAIEQGMRIVALDMPEEQKKGYDVVDDFVEYLYARNYYMCEIIEDILSQDENNRIVTLNGAFHVDNSSSGMAGIMQEQYRRNTVAVRFGGGQTAVDLDGGIIVNEGSDFEKSVREANVELEEFMVQVDDSDSIVPQCDWMIHLPQIESPSEGEIELASLRRSIGFAKRIINPLSQKPPDYLIEDTPTDIVNLLHEYIYLNDGEDATQ